MLLNLLGPPLSQVEYQIRQAVSADPKYFRILRILRIFGLCVVVLHSHVVIGRATNLSNIRYFVLGGELDYAVVCTEVKVLDRLKQRAVLQLC